MKCECAGGGPTGRDPETGGTVRRLVHADGVSPREGTRPHRTTEATARPLRPWGRGLRNARTAYVFLTKWTDLQ